MTKIINLHQVDAFTDVLFGGNPAGVVTNADELNDEQMLKIAREMNLSETAFVLKPTFADADLKLRFFTPSAEVQFCGHATVGALYELTRLKMFGLGHGVSRIKAETGIGVLEMEIALGVDDNPRISFTAPPTKMEEYDLQGLQFAEKFGIQQTALNPDAKVFRDNNLNYLYIPVESLKILGDLQFDLPRIREKFAQEKTVVFCLYTNQTFKAESDLHARITCPLIGIDEDPFTGSAQAGLVQAAKQNWLVGPHKQNFIVEQGNFLGRPGHAEVKINQSGETKVIANAVHVFSTQMEIK